MLFLTHDTIKAEAAERHRRAALYRYAHTAKKQRQAHERASRKQRVWAAKRRPRALWRPSPAR